MDLFVLDLVSSSSWILLLAALIDFLIGDPWGWLHPVQVMGWLINKVSWLAIKFCSPGWQRRLAGLLLGVLLIAGSGFLAWAVGFYLGLINSLLGEGIQIVLLASCFAGRSLRVAVLDVLKPLAAGNILQARSHLSRYVGRDTENLSQSEILRALLETVAENSVDGVTAPLFYGIVGSYLAVGAAPLALAYKAASTLDSMIGYLREPYRDLGWFSAQLEDLLTWIPCRLTVLTLGLLTAKPRRVWQICCRDGFQDPSPNSGWSEAAYAAILGVQLGGENTYQGVVKSKPLLGDAVDSISPAKIQQALNLTRYCCLFWLAIAILGDICL
ncbi:MAG: adenosylcobinamide-phosphate synthase CbiB [Cyanobacteria bacterium J06621_8]